MTVDQATRECMMNNPRKDKRCTERCNGVLDRAETYKYRCCIGRCIPTERRPKKYLQLFEVRTGGQNACNTGSPDAVVVQDGLGMYRQLVWNDNKSNWIEICVG